MDIQQRAQQLQNTKEKNLAFFQRRFPSIYENFKDRKLMNAELNLDPSNGIVNLVENGQALYPLHVVEANQKEAQQASDSYSGGNRSHPLMRSHFGHFYRGRFFHGTLSRFIEEANQVVGGPKPYTYGKTLPQVVFLGSGLGIHIEAFLRIRQVRHVVLVEHNADRFLASLYVTDWENIITPYIKNKESSFILSVGDNTQFEKEEDKVYTAYAGAWNNIAQNVPFMPLQTIYYNHLADPFYEKVVTRLNDEMLAYFGVWGYYDDEVNQLNHVFHNIEQGIPVLKRIDLSGSSKVTLICGNGPSLDNYLDFIKQNRDKLHIIGAGSATHSLLKNDIYPDFIVTLESDYATYKALQVIPKDKVKNTPVIAAAQVHPGTFGLFKEGLMYIKQETTYATLFDKYDAISVGTPSATNAALAVAVDLNLKNIYLLGMDFGFKDPTKSHSDSSFYSEEENTERFKDFKDKISKDSFLLETNQFGDIHTTSFYNTARNHAEKKILNSDRFDIKNLSEGASIEGVDFMEKSEFEAFIQTKSASINTQEPPLFDVIKKVSEKIKLKENEKVKRNFVRALNKLKRQILNELETMQPNLDSIETTIYKINHTVIRNTDTDIIKLHMSIRGTLWHWLFNFYALCKEQNAEQHYEYLVNQFKQYFGGFINYLPKHFEHYLSARVESDPKLELSVADAEPNVDEWFKKVKNYKKSPRTATTKHKRAAK